MPQHFLLSSRAKTLSLANVFTMTDGEAEAMFLKFRWAETDGIPICPSCATDRPYDCRRASGLPRFRCRACRKDFSITSGTLFASLKLPLKIYLAAIVMFCNEHRGKSMLAMSRDLGLSYKAAFVLCHKIREAMASNMRGCLMGGEGKIVEIDGAYFGGYVKPANLKSKRVDRRLLLHLTGKRKAVVVIRERGGQSLPAVFKNEGSASRYLMARIRRETVIHADDSSAWDPLHAMFKMKRINHKHAYSLNGACTNGAEGYFSRLRRFESGHGHISGPYLLRYAQEAAFRENERRSSNGAQVQKVLMLAGAAKSSVDFTGYWQRAKTA